jgi:hypothetical protein
VLFATSKAKALLCESEEPLWRPLKSLLKEKKKLTTYSSYRWLASFYFSYPNYLALLAAAIKRAAYQSQAPL